MHHSLLKKVGRSGEKSIPVKFEYLNAVRHVHDTHLSMCYRDWTSRTNQTSSELTNGSRSIFVFPRSRKWRHFQLRLSSILERTGYFYQRTRAPLIERYIFTVQCNASQYNWIHRNERSAIYSLGSVYMLNVLQSAELKPQLHEVLSREIVFISRVTSFHHRDCLLW